MEGDYYLLQFRDRRTIRAGQLFDHDEGELYVLEEEWQDYFRFLAEYVSEFTELNLYETQRFSAADLIVGAQEMNIGGYAFYPFFDGSSQ
ncbi:MAG: hypothetical protein OXC63_15670 [Aestuariivita sp.]|nr:hypothetical protein [Aestuariivita sp.]MCY4346036.1 hypothetical protein [Aestuariivita sp.]